MLMSGFPDREWFRTSSSNRAMAATTPHSVTTLVRHQPTLRSRRVRGALISVAVGSGRAGSADDPRGAGIVDGVEPPSRVMVRHAATTRSRRGRGDIVCGVALMRPG